MMGNGNTGSLRIAVSAIIGLLLAIAPLPHWLEVVRPDFLLLFVVYWSLTAPRVAGLTFAWLCGFGIDLLHGVVLGQHALMFLLVGAITHRWQLQLRIFPVWQQAAWVWLMLLIYQFGVFWIDGIISQPVTTWQRWLPVFSGAILWPTLVAVLDTWNRRRR